MSLEVILIWLYLEKPSMKDIKVLSVRISALKSYCMMLCMILCVTLCITWCLT